MTMNENDLKFIQLLRYVELTLPTKECRVKKFIRGLKSSMYKVMVSQIFSSYSSDVDSIRLMEAREVEEIVVSQFKRPR